jgi:hypothetical protein
VSAELLDHFATLKGIASGKDREMKIGLLLSKPTFDVLKYGGYSGGVKQLRHCADAQTTHASVSWTDPPPASTARLATSFHNLLSRLARIWWSSSARAL